MKQMRLLFAVLPLTLFLSSLQAQTVPVGGTIPNPTAWDLNFQLAIPDPSNPNDPWKEVSTGVVKAGGAVQVPNDPNLCGVVLRIVAWDFSNPPLVIGPFYVTITC